MVNVKNNAATIETRARLIEAAGRVFAEEGFENATVREICDRAGVNNAAINYHFGDKTELYESVLREAHCAARAEFDAHQELLVAAPPEEQLRRFITMIVGHFLDESRPAWSQHLIAREMATPTAALDRVVDEVIRPMTQFLHQVVTRLLSPRNDPDTGRHAVGSIMGQCLLYKHCRAVVERLYPEQRFDAAGIDEIAAHITRFSLAALRGMRDDAGAGTR